MKKIVMYFISSLMGICIGVVVHCNFMIVQAEGCLMLPVIEPDQYVLISLLDNDIKEGDIVAIKSPYYTLEGEGNIIFRSLSYIEGDSLTLSCKTRLAKENNINVAKKDILGKVIYPKVK